MLRSAEHIVGELHALGLMAAHQQHEAGDHRGGPEQGETIGAKRPRQVSQEVTVVSMAVGDVHGDR